MPTILPDEMQPAVKHYMPLQDALDVALHVLDDVIAIYERDKDGDPVMEQNMRDAKETLTKFRSSNNKINAWLDKQ